MAWKIGEKVLREIMRIERKMYNQVWNIMFIFLVQVS